MSVVGSASFFIVRVTTIRFVLAERQLFESITAIA